MEQVLALITPADTVRGMFFNGLLETARQVGGEEVRVHCFTAMGQKKYVDFISYPVADFFKSIYAACDVLGPRLGGQEAVMRMLGRRSTADFLQSTVGRTMLALAGKDPHRVLAAIPSACRASLSYGERSIKPLSKQSGMMQARHDFLPAPYNEGVLLAALEQSSARNIQVRSVRLGPIDVDYEVEWS